MTSKHARVAKRARQANAILNKGPKRPGRGDGGRLLPDLIAPLPVNGFTQERLSREAADLSAQLRRMDVYDERRTDLEHRLFWVRMRQEGQCQ